jgi:large subunit ribosomal protein L31e
MIVNQEKQVNEEAQNKPLDESMDETSELEEVLKEETPEEVEVKEVSPEEEAKPAAKKKKEEEDIVEERIYTVPLSKALIMPPKRRTPRAMRILEAFITKHMKLDVRLDEDEEEATKRLIISNEVNERIWAKGIGKPPRKIRVRAAKDKDGVVSVYLAEGE